MPQAIGAVAYWIGSGAVYLTSSAAVGNFVYVVAYAATAYGTFAAAGSLLKPKLPGGSLNNGSPLQLTRDTTTAHRIIYGQTRVSGALRFAQESGPKREFLNLIVVHAAHECAGISTLYFGDEVLQMSGDDVLGDYAGHARITTHLGASDQLADANFIAELPTKWTAAHRLRGLCYTATRLKWNQDIFPGGFPAILALVRGRLVYDPRTTATAWSANPALCLLDYLTNTDFGLAVDLATEVETASFIAAANVCDEPIDLAANFTRACDVASGNNNIGMVTQAAAQLDGIVEGQPVAGAGIPVGARVTYVNRAGPDFYFSVDLTPTATANPVTLTFGDTEPRYEVNGAFETTVEPGTVIDQLLAAMAGTLVYTGGKWVCHAGAHRTATVTLDESDLRGPIKSTRLASRDLCNRVKGTFANPADKYQPADFPAVKNDTYLAADNGVKMWRDLDLPFTTSPSMSQRLAKIDLERTRQDISVDYPCQLTALQVRPGDVVAINNTRRGWSGKLFAVTDWRFQVYDYKGSPALGVDLVLRETAAGVWDWNNGEETILDLASNTDLPDPRRVVAPTGLVLTSGAATTYQQPDGTTIPRLKVSWNDPGNEFVSSGGQTRIEYKTTAAPDWTPWNTPRGEQLFDFIADVQIGTEYLVRIRHENNLGAVSPWATSAGHTVAGDTSGPGIPQNLTATAGAGFVSLDWDDNTELDLSEYKVYRGTTNVFADATFIAEVAASRFVDAQGLTTGTTYYYWIAAVDRSENVGTQSNIASAAPTAPNNTTAPATPAAPTFNSESTYLSGDGTVFAQVTINTPALPAGAVLNTILYRISGSGSWIIADQQTGAATARIDDLSPGVAYEFGVRGLSNGVGVSAVSTPLSRTAPNTTTAPAAPSGPGFDIASIPLGLTGTSVDFGSRIVWSAASTAEVDYWQVKATLTDSDAATNYAGNLGGPQPFSASGPGVLIYTNDISFARYVRVRAVSRSGVASAWTRVGQLNLVGNTILSGGNMAAQNADSVTTTGVRIGGGGAAKQAAQKPYDSVVTLTGGAPTETVDVGISGEGFSVRPDWSSKPNIASSDDIDARYDWDNSTSTTARLIFSMKDGSNLPNHAVRFSVIFGEY